MERIDDLSHRTMSYSTKDAITLQNATEASHPRAPNALDHWSILRGLQHPGFRFFRAHLFEGHGGRITQKRAPGRSRSLGARVLQGIATRPSADGYGRRRQSHRREQVYG